MAEYIDKAVAVDIMNAKAEMGVCSEYAACFHAAAKMLELLPAADVVPVVRCKDCNWHSADGYCLNPKCGKSWYGCPVPDEHYCSYGERRADA